VSSTLGVGTEFIVTLQLSNQRQSRQQYLLSGLDVIYYYYQDSGALLEELQRLGARVTVTCHQHEQLVIDDINDKNFDMVMFAEDMLPSRAEALARRIRASETNHRALLVY